MMRKEPEPHYTYDHYGQVLTREMGNGLYTSEPTIVKMELWQYDVFNRMVQYNTGGTSAGYSYKPNGYRLSKTVNGEKTTHMWHGANMVVDLDGGNGIKNRYIRRINLVKSDRNEYYVYNAHGDVTQLTSMAGAVTRSYTFDAFGWNPSRELMIQIPSGIAGSIWT